MSWIFSSAVMWYALDLWQSVYFVSRLLLAIFFSVPLHAFYLLPRINRPRPSWSWTRSISLRLTKEVVEAAFSSGPLFFQPNHFTLRTNGKVEGIWIEPVPAQIVGELKEWARSAGVEYVRIPGYWTRKDKEDLGPSSRKVLYSLHGGAYAVGSAHPSELCSIIPRSIMQHSHAISRTFSIEYRLAKSLRSQNPFPAALLDAIAGYIYLARVAHVPPSDIVIVGDSAGANLALALTRYLVENQDRHDVDLPPPPTALVLCSPWVDLSTSDIKDGGSPITNRDLDIIDSAGLTMLRLIRNYLGPHGLYAAKANRYISPAAQTPEMKSISFHGFPRTFITAGGFETIRDQARILYHRMARDLGKAVMYYEMEEAVHDLLVLPWYHKPDQVKLLQSIGPWIDIDSEDILLQALKLLVY